MKGIGLGPSPNWYCSKISDCNKAGIFAFGAKHDVYLLDLKTLDSCQTPQYAGSLLGHTDKVVGLRFCPNSYRTSELVSVSENGVIKMWDVSLQVGVKEINTGNKNKMTCIDWSPHDLDLLVAGDDKGAIFLCSASDDGKRLLHVSQGPISCISLSPHEANLLVVGFRDGLIVIVDVKALRNIHVLQRHDQIIQSLSWIPKSFSTRYFDPSADSNEMKTYFVSSSKDATIRIWNPNDGETLVTLKLPLPSGYRLRNFDDKSQNRLWISLTCSLEEENVIVCSGYNGELLSCTFSEDGHHWNVINQHKGPVHQRCIFSISSFSSYLCTVSMDRQIIVWNFSQKTSICALPTLGGFVYCLQFSPVDIGYLAAGVGDNMIRVWNMQPSVGPYTVESMWQGIKSKITSVAWHPKQEGHLAFGTDEGHVGIYNLRSNKPPRISKTCHRGTVYSLSWGPRISASGKENDQELCLYACGGGQILIHIPSHLQKDNSSLNINDVIQYGTTFENHDFRRSEVTWNSDLSFLAIGNEDGSIEILKPPTLNCVLIITELKRQIQCLRWHPTFTALSSLVQSECSFWLAAAGCDSAVFIFDLKKELEQVNEDHIHNVPNLSKCTWKLQGHKSRVVSLCWSPHIDGQLISVSYDGTAQVWEGITGKPLANFRGHRGRIFSAAWSTFDPDIVFTGGEDFTLQQWKISEQKNLLPPKRNDERKKKNNNKKKTVVEHQDVKPKLQNSAIEDLQALLELKKASIIAANAKVESKPTPSDDISSENVDVLDISSEKAEIYDISSEKAEIYDISSEKAEINDISFEKAEINDIALANADIPNKLDVVESEVQQADEQKDTDSVNFVKNNSASRKKKKKKYKSLFPFSSNLENRGKAHTLEDILILANCNHASNNGAITGQHLSAASDEIALNDADSELKKNSSFLQEEELTSCPIGEGDFTHLGLFGGRTDALRMLATETSHHQKLGQWENALQLEIWKGNIGKALELAAEHNQLSDWMIALAPLGSHDLWFKMCKLYSEQLLREGNPLRACLYLLAVHDIYGAIDLLKTHSSFKEAVALAKARLSPDDPKLRELILEWSEQLMKDENYEQAAKCLISCNMIKDAASSLLKRSDYTTLKTASYLSMKIGDLNNAMLCASKSLWLSEVRHDWDSCFEIINAYPQLKTHMLVVVLHRMFVEELNVLNKDQTLWQTQSTISWENLDVWTEHFVKGKPFMCAVLDEWMSENLFETENVCAKATQSYKWLDDNGLTWQSATSANEVMMQCAYHLTLSLLAALANNPKQSLMNIVHCLAASDNEDSMQTFQGICRLLLPQGVGNGFRRTLPFDDSSVIEHDDELTYLMESIIGYYSLFVLHSMQSLKTEILHTNLKKWHCSNAADDNSYDNSRKLVKSDIFGFKITPGIIALDAALVSQEGNIIHLLQNNLLIKHRIRKYFLDIRLSYVKKTIAQILALNKFKKTTEPSKSNDDKAISNIKEDIKDDKDHSDSDIKELSDVALETETKDNDTAAAIKENNMVDEFSTSSSCNESCSNGQIAVASLEREKQDLDFEDHFPFDEYYQENNFSIPELLDEQKRIKKVLEILQSSQVCNFPDPMKSILLLLQYYQSHELHDLRDKLASWALAHCPRRCDQDDFQVFTMQHAT